MMTRLFLGACVLTVGLVVGLTGCDGVSTSPDDISRTAAADSLRPTPKNASAVPDSLKQVAPGGTLTIPAEAVANAPDDPQGAGPLRFGSVGVADTTLATVTNNDTEAVLDAAGASGTVTVDFRPDYGNFVSTEVGSLSVAIQEGNQAPTATDDSAMTTAGEATTTDVLANDIDPDGSLDASTVQVESEPSSGTASANTDGTITYDPDDGFTGTDSYTYSVADDAGAADTAEVTIEVNEANQAPTAKNDTLMTDEETETSDGEPGVLENDTDPDGDDRSVSKVNGSAGDVGTEITLSSGALLTLNADGSYTYDPNDAFEDLGKGDTGSDSFDYTASDGKGGTDQATVDVTINGVNDAPEMETNAGLSVDQGESAPITMSDLSATDPDDDPSALIYEVTTAPTQGTLLVGGEPDSSFTQAQIEGEVVEYDHDFENADDDSFTFDLCDGSGAEGCPSGRPFDITVNNQ